MLLQIGGGPRVENSQARRHRRHTGINVLGPIVGASALLHPGAINTKDMRLGHAFRNAICIREDEIDSAVESPKPGNGAGAGLGINCVGIRDLLALTPFNNIDVIRV